MRALISRALSTLSCVSSLIAIGCGSGDDVGPAVGADGSGSEAQAIDGAADTVIAVASTDAGSETGVDGGGEDGPVSVVLTAAELALAQTLSPLPTAPPADPTNRVADDPGAAALGQRFFFDRRFSGALAVGDDGTNGGLGPVGAQGRIACASCHAGPALADARSRPGNVSLGADFLPRNAPPLVNSAFYTWTNWAGRFSAQWELPIAVVENPKNMNGDRLRVAHVVFTNYRTDYEALFGALEPALGSDATRFPPSGKPKAAGSADGPWETTTPADQKIVNVILVNFGKTLEAYVRKLIGGPSAFDRYVAGDSSALSDAQVRGLKVFLGAGECIECHSGPLLSDNLFHNLGVPQIGPNVPATDTGRFADTTSLLASAFNTAGAYSDDTTTGRLSGLVSPPPDSAEGQFRTASLRNVAVTAPYMHAGQLATLANVVDYYAAAASIVPPVGTLDPLLSGLVLSPQQKADLVAFLESLTGSGVASDLLGDTSAP
jgi:cytochrome c peroxidase